MSTFIKFQAAICMALIGLCAQPYLAHASVTLTLPDEMSGGTHVFTIELPDGFGESPLDQYGIPGKKSGTVKIGPDVDTKRVERFPLKKGLSDDEDAPAKKKRSSPRKSKRSSNRTANVQTPKKVKKMSTMEQRKQARLKTSSALYLCQKEICDCKVGYAAIGNKLCVRQ